MRNGGSRGRVQGVRTPPEMTCGFLINTVQSASQLYKICFIIWYVFSAVHIMLLPSRKPSSSYSLLKFVYVTSQLRHSIVVHPHLRKTLDPPLMCLGGSRRWVPLRRERSTSLPGCDDMSWPNLRRWSNPWWWNCLLRRVEEYELDKWPDCNYKCSLCRNEMGNPVCEPWEGRRQLHEKNQTVRSAGRGPRWWSCSVLNLPFFLACLIWI